MASGQQLDPAAAKALKRLNATVSGYSFLYFCDSRVGICDSGPYPRPDGRHTIVRDYLSLGPSAWGYPWAERLDPPFAGLTMALTFDPAAFPYFEINDWGTTFTEPDQLLSRRSRRPPSSATAPTAPPRSSARTGGRDRSDSPATTWPSTSVRQHGPRRADLVGDPDVHRGPASLRRGRVRARPIDWSFSPDTSALHPDPLDDDGQAAAIFGTALVANDLPGSFSPIR